MNDLKFALRMLLKNPGFTAVAVLTLALGIGANTAIFSIVNTVLLCPLPVRDPDRVVLVTGSRPQQSRSQIPLSLPNLNDAREQNQVFEGMAAWMLGRMNITGDTEPEQVQSATVSANFFSVFGVKPILGREFLPVEDQPDGPAVAVLSHNLWQHRFGSDPSAIGKTLLLDGRTHEVVGVMPATFKFARFPKETEVWLPFGLDSFRNRKFAREVNSLFVAARLKSGVSVARAEADVEAISRRLEQQFPVANAGWRLKLVPLSQQVVKNLRTALLVLLGAVGFVLLIACANVANLLLARAAFRQKEIAVRAALGAGRWLLLRQALTENVLLALIGGAAGLLAAFWSLDLFAAIPFSTPDLFTPFDAAQQRVHLDGRVFGFTFGLSILTGLLFGLVPAIQASRVDLNQALKESVLAGFAGHRVRSRSFLVVAEIALSLVLLVGAGLMLRSFLRLQEIDPGFRPENVLAMDLSLAKNRFTNAAQTVAFHRQALDRIKNLPGVQAAGAVEYLPLSGLDGIGDLKIEGHPEPQPGEEIRAHYRSITPDYFQAMGIPVLKGRAFVDRDDRTAPRVAIINETMARRYWPNESPIGKRLALVFEALRFFPDRPPEFDLNLGLREIVAVVGDVKHSNLEADPTPEMYVPLFQRPVPDATLVIRTSSDPLSLAAAIRGEIRALDKDQPVSNIRTLPQLLAQSVARPRFNLLLLSGFAVLALVLAMIGVYGVMSYAVNQRTRELGIRVALGAKPWDVLRLILREAMTLAAAGIGLGLAGALMLTRVIRTLLFEVRPSDPFTYVSVTLLLAAVALAACWLPAWRATKVDPLLALRHE